MWKRRYTDVHKKTKSCKLCIFNPYSFRVIYPWNLPSLFETFLILMSIARGFSDHLPDWYPINKYLIKGEFLLRGTKLWNFIFHKELFQLSGEKCCLFSTSIWMDTKIACWVWRLVFLKTWVIALFWHWRSKIFRKDCSHDFLKAFR